MAGDTFLLQHENTQVEGDGVEAGREGNPRAGFPGCCMMKVDLLPHPGRFAAEIGVIRARCHTGCHQYVAI